MDPFSVNMIASTRRDEFLREAAEERQVRIARRDRRRHQQAEARPEPRRHEVARPAVA
jgi:hypothetical protein